MSSIVGPEVPQGSVVPSQENLDLSAESSSHGVANPWRILWRGLGGGTIVVGSLLGGLVGGLVLAHWYPQALTPEASAQRQPWLEQVVSWGYQQGYQWRMGSQPENQGSLAAPAADATALTLSDTALEQVDLDRLRRQTQDLYDRALALEADLSSLEKTLNLSPLENSTPISDRLTSIQSTLAQASSAQQSVSLPLTIVLPADSLFVDGTSQWQSTAPDLLDNLAETLTQELAPLAQQPLLVTIGTHTDDLGPAPMNLSLSFQRSQALKTYLSQGIQAQGFPGTIAWNPIGYGETSPQVPNDSNEHRQRNRRVEVVITPQF